jgi:hypothetical protein
MATFDGKIQRRGAGEIACVYRSAMRQQKVDHLKMTEPRGVAKWPGTKPVTRVDRRPVVQELSR